MEIEGYPNYLIYEDGRVYTKNYNRFLKPSIKRGYLTYGLSNNSKCKTLLVHRIIAIHYIPNPDNKPEVDHIDRNKLNNNISNLRWATKSMNNLNRILPPSNTGEKHISIITKKKWKYYLIIKINYFRESLPCSKYTLEDAIMLRDALLSMEDDVV